MQRFHLSIAFAMWCAALRQSGHAVTAFSSSSSRVLNKHRQSSKSLVAVAMSTATPPSSATQILPRVKAVDATEPSEGPVLVKGWVRTVRKQKTLAFVEVNDGSNMGGIQCVLSFDAIDDATQEGKGKNTSLSFM